MKICIAGAGAIGGYLGAKLSAADQQVSLIARGAHLRVIQQDGLRLTDAGGAEMLHVHPACSDNPTDFGPQDFVILTVKAPSLIYMAPLLTPLIGPDTIIVAAMNGIPWWFCTGVGGPLEGRHLYSVDPDRKLAALLPPERLLGCVVHGGCEVSAPGTVRHMAGGEFILGHPIHATSEHADALAIAIAQAGAKAHTHPRIHDAIWHKLLGNLSMNPVAALTGATLAEMAENRSSRRLIATLMAEAMAVGDRLNLDNGSTIEDRIDLGASLGAFKASMLQDMEQGRPLEIDALLTVVCELAKIAGIETPAIEAVRALLILKTDIRDARSAEISR